MSEFLSRPFVLTAATVPKAWGWESWLTSAQPPADARLAKDGATLGGLALEHPEVLGHWARRIFGNTVPIFAKLIHTHFPGRVHMGFRRAVSKGELLGWLDAEQEAVRGLFKGLRIHDPIRWSEYEASYAAWATEQALEAWRRDDDEVAALALQPFFDAGLDVRSSLRGIRHNRARLVDVLNDVDLEAESGQMMLMGAGVVHAIFGLSHQTHPKDRSRGALEALFGTLSEREAASDAEIIELIDAAGVSELRAQNSSPPKNEAWLPTTVNGQAVLAEPQQSSDTTYSLADFYTPLVWSEGGVRFRKGAAEAGLSRDELAGYLTDVDFDVTPVSSMRRSPVAVPNTAHRGAELFRLVDEPARWPFFTAYQLELHGEFSAAPPEGVFQELLVTRGRVTLSDSEGAIGELSPEAPGFIPATLDGKYTLASDEPATVLILSVPGARSWKAR